MSLNTNASIPQFVVTATGDLFGPDSPEALEIARRIHACVNACEGFSTEELESGILVEMRETLQMLEPMLRQMQSPPATLKIA